MGLPSQHYNCRQHHQSCQLRTFTAAIVITMVTVSNPIITAYYDTVQGNSIKVFSLAYFPKVDLWILHAVCASPTINFWMPEPIFMKLGVYIHITVPKPISTAHFINPSQQSVCLYVHPLSLLGKNPLNVARQWLGKNVTMTMNTHTTEELSDALFSMWSVSHQGKQEISPSRTSC
jgi:hypothetical protein